MNYRHDGDVIRILTESSFDVYPSKEYFLEAERFFVDRVENGKPNIGEYRVGLDLIENNGLGQVWRITPLTKETEGLLKAVFETEEVFTKRLRRYGIIR